MTTDDKIESSVSRWLNNKRSSLECLLAQCESPVEKMLLLAMIVPSERDNDCSWPDWVPKNAILITPILPLVDELSIDGSNYGPNSDEACASRKHTGIEGGCWVGWQYGALGLVFLVAQPRFCTDGRNVRADFVIIGRECKIAIEVDGHDFHERAKEQAARDRSRDRAMFVDGWNVLRFTGAEVWRDAEACAFEVARFMQLESIRRLMASGKF